MGKWEIATFGDVLTIINGKNQKQVKNPLGKYPIYGSGGVMGYADDYLCEANTVVIGRKGTINKPIYVEESFWNVDTAFGLRANDVILLPKYLFYFCQKYDFESLNTTVTIPSLTKANLLKIKIPLPPLDVQQKIANVLDKASALIELRRAQLEKLDLLIKSQFIEMFGDKHSNSYKWPIKLLGELCSFESGKAHEQVVDQNGAYKLITSKFIATDGMEYRRTNTVLSPLHIGDIVMVLSDVPNGRALAKCFLVDAEDLYSLNQRICAFRNESCNKVYLYYLLNRHPYFLNFNDGDSQTNLRKGDVLNCKMILPPLELQDQFATFVQKVDQSKFTLQQSLSQLELNYKSLMQKCFRGEIF